MKKNKNTPWSMSQNKKIQKKINLFKDKTKKLTKYLNGKKITFQNDSVLARFKNNLNKEFNWLKKIGIKNNSTIFDVGSNVGINTICYKILFKNSKIFSFEPIPNTIKIFKKNIKLNKIKNIKVFNMGFSNKKKISSLSIPSEKQGDRYKYFVNHALYSIYGKGKNKIKAKFDTIDNFISKKKFSEINFIKIDVEGHELKVLEGATKTIKRFKPIIQLEYNYISKILTKTKISDFIKFASKFDYKIILLGKGFKLIHPNLKDIKKYHFSDIIFK